MFSVCFLCIFLDFHPELEQFSGREHPEFHMRIQDKPRGCIDWISEVIFV